MGDAPPSAEDRLIPSRRFLAVWTAVVALVTLLAWFALPRWHWYSHGRAARVERGTVRRAEAAGKRDHLTIECAGRTVQLEVGRPSGIYAPQATREGERVLVRFVKQDGHEEEEASVGPKVRDRTLLVVLAIFFLLLGVAGGARALRTALSLVAAFLLLLVVLLPLVIRGWNPLVVTVPLAAAIAAGTICVVAGPNRKSAAALLGTMGGLGLAVGAAAFTAWLLNLTGLGIGFGQHRNLDLVYWQSDRIGHIHFQNLLVAGVVLSCLGAAMDVAITVATAVHEVAANRPDIPRREAIRAGLSVGRAAVWMTAATLFFVLLGANMEPFLVRSLGHGAAEWVRLMSFEEIAVEVVRIGTAGLTMTLVAPLTALFAGLLLAQSHAQPARGRNDEIGNRQPEIRIDA